MKTPAVDPTPLPHPIPPANPPLSVQEDVKRKKKRNFWLITLGIFFLLIGILWFLYWLFIGRFYVYTDDAYVHGNEVMLTPQVSAGVKAIYADETNLVKKGQLIVELDSSDFQIRFEDAKKNLSNIVREVSTWFQNARAKEAQVNLREAQLLQAQLDFEHRIPLFPTGAVSKEEFETFGTNVKVAQAALEFTRREFDAAQALIAGTTIETHPRVVQAAWFLRQAYLNLIRCQIWSPVTGYIAKRTVQVGDMVKIGDTLLYIVPLDYLWLNANYKETKLSRVRIGQPVTYTADLYGREVKFHGVVLGFQPGSGNAFSLLPPENASGNWIKIVQRVPVRISVDPQAIQEHPLFLGLSMRVTVDIHDTSGKMLAEVPTFEPLFYTQIYNKQLEDMVAIDPLIEDLIATNQTVPETPSSDPSQQDAGPSLSQQNSPSQRLNENSFERMLFHQKRNSSPGPSRQSMNRENISNQNGYGSRASLFNAYPNENRTPPPFQQQSRCPPFRIPCLP